LEKVRISAVAGIQQSFFLLFSSDTSLRLLNSQVGKAMCLLLQVHKELLPGCADPG